MFVDRLFSQLNTMEVYCIICGDRKFYSKTKDSTGAELDRLERLREYGL